MKAIGINSNTTGLKTYYSHIDQDAIDSMTLNLDNDKLYLNVNLSYHFPLETGWQLFIANEFLRSMNLDVNIEYKDFRQYQKLLNNCTKQLKEQQNIRRKKQNHRRHTQRSA